MHETRCLQASCSFARLLVTMECSSSATQILNHCPVDESGAAGAAASEASYQRRCGRRRQRRRRGRVRQHQLREVLLVEGDRVYALRVLHKK